MSTTYSEQPTLHNWISRTLTYGKEVRHIRSQMSLCFGPQWDYRKSRGAQTLQPPPPTPFLHNSLYKMGKPKTESQKPSAMNKGKP
jgi:hypothetical protein